MITTILFNNFKALNHFVVRLKDVNVLTGPNNNGKSTLLDGIRALHGAYRYASRYIPKYLALPYGYSAWGYQIPESSIPIILNNIQNDFNTNEPATVKFKFEDEQSLTLLFHANHAIYLTIETSRKIPKSTIEFKTEFPLNISIIPTLGPFEINEEILQKDYVTTSYGGRRSARMFRNYWFYNPENFEQFKELVETTWKGMSISPSYKPDPFSKELVMLCSENRIPREISWAGFGFQIWLQLLTHIVNSQNADLIIVDEPEIYLHPELQHKVFDILKNTKARIIIATHSVEIINNVEPTDVLLIDKNNKSAKRISDLEGLQNVSYLLGSGQNLQLTKLARGKKILFVEGKDVKLLNRFARINKMDDLFTNGEITVISIDGFSQHDKIIHTNWAFTQILGEDLKISVLLDRDFRSDEEIEEVYNKLNKVVSYVHILKRKEIENYLLIPNAIEKAINIKLQERINTGTVSKKININITELLSKITDEFKSTVSSQIIAHKLRLRNTYKDIATILKETTTAFEKNWENLEYRLNVISGKDFLTNLNYFLQTEYKLSITNTQISSFISTHELDNDLQLFLEGIKLFSKN